MNSFQRADLRAADALRPVTIERGYTRHAEGSVLVSFGHTRVLCTASVEEKVPPHNDGSVLAVEKTDRLRPAVLENTKRVLGETADVATLFVLDGDVQHDQFGLR